MPLTVLIADDEELARRRLRRLLADIDDVDVAGECAGGVEVLRHLAEQSVDVLLLDIHMPGLTGLEALRLLPEPRPYVVFCTAHAEHAVSAFEVGAVDYLLKPIEGERLARALDRARRLDVRERQREAVRTDEVAAITRLPVATRDGIVLVAPPDIVSATLEGELVRLRTTKGDHLSADSLQTIHDKLASAEFERVHRRALVNLQHVVRLEPLETGGYLAHTTLGDAVEVSRQAARSLRKRLGLRKGEEA
jgi:two-component system LytT family response regulator